MQVLRLIFLSLILTGCANVDFTEIPPQGIDATFIAHKFRGDTQSGNSIYDVVKLDTNPGYTMIDDFNAYKRWWCSKDINYEYKFASAFKSHCQSLRGTIVGDWCETDDGFPLFKTRLVHASEIQKAPKSTGMHCTLTTSGIGVITITGEKQYTEPEWLYFAKKNGFIPHHIRDNKIKQIQKKLLTEGVNIAQGIFHFGDVACKSSDKKYITKVAYVIKPNPLTLYDGNTILNIKDNYHSDWYRCF